MLSATTSSNNGCTIIAARPELRILLVEDSLPLQNRLVDMLTKPGIMCVTAKCESEAQAKAYIDQEDFDVLVVDIELRPGSGINVIRHARKRANDAANNAANDTKVAPVPLIIVLTNHTSTTVRDLSMHAGADHFLDKMRQFDHLYPLIQDHPF